MSIVLDLRSIRMRDHVTVAQAASRLSVTRQAVHKMVARGRLTGYRLGRIVLITRESLDALQRTYRYAPSVRDVEVSDE